MGRAMRDGNQAARSDMIKQITASLFFFCVCFGLFLGAPIRARAEIVSGKIPVTVNADHLDYDRTNDVYVAVGHVHVEQEGMKLEAEKMVLNNKTGEAVAEGNVYLQDKGDVIRADRLQINVNTKSGVISHGSMFMKKDNLHVNGETIERKSENVYHVEKGTFTTCDASEWYLKADEIDVDMDRYATGRGVSFNLSGLPVLYTPYLLFPVRRQSGLLMPELGYSSKDGFLMKNSLFWAISEAQDATLYSDYRAHFGHGTGIEYRYVNSRDSAGQLFYNYFDMFDRFRAPSAPSARWQLLFKHDEEIADDLSFRADINLVSDFAYFTDIEQKLELRSRPYLESNLFYIERWDAASLNLLGQYAVDLTRKSNENAVQKLPELRYNVYEERLAGPLYLNVEGKATNFTVPGGNNVMRAYFDPRLSAVIGNGLTLTPRVGGRAVFYDQSATSSEPVSRTYSYAGADLNARISSIYGTDGDEGIGRIRHSIEPTISYTYIPRIDQTDTPQVDALDAVSAQNTVDVSLINRLTAHYKDPSGFKSFDLMVFRVSEAYDLNKARSSDTAISSQARSQINGELYLKTPKLLTISAIESYDTYTHSLTSSSESLAITGEAVRFNVTRQYLRNPETRYLIGGGGYTAGKWDVNVQIWRDLVQELTTQQEYKLHYASQCWGLGIVFTKKPGETQYLATFELKGLGAVKF
jgi:LPS-assembly protein